MSAPSCTCWFNTKGELIYREDACPVHGPKAQSAENPAACDQTSERGADV